MGGLQRINELMAALTKAVVIVAVGSLSGDDDCGDVEEETDKQLTSTSLRRLRSSLMANLEITLH